MAVEYACGQVDRQDFAQTPVGCKNLIESTCTLVVFLRFLDLAARDDTLNAIWELISLGDSLSTPEIDQMRFLHPTSYLTFQ